MTNTKPRPTRRSDQIGECQCEACQSACRHKPGWFRPDQIAPLAKAMGLTIKELFTKHLQIDYWLGEPTIFVLSPRLADARGGTVFPNDPTGACHWFKDGCCQIHALGKPVECQQLGHRDGEIVGADHRTVAMSWKAKRHQDTIRRLYGREPTTPPSSAMSLINMLLR